MANALAKGEARKRVGASGYWLACPGCGNVGTIDDDQAAGRVSILCDCGFHETRQFIGAGETDGA